MKVNLKEEEFLELIKNHQGIIHKICFIYCSNSHDRQDLYQEITLQLWKSYSSFKGESAFSTWMYRVALNTAITTSKKFGLFLNTNDYQPEAVDMETERELSEDIRTLYRAISYLKKIEKAIILLWLEEKSYVEIADTIGISEKNVSVRLVRIKARLSGIIKKLQ